jgi:hypothetical protein
MFRELPSVTINRAGDGSPNDGFFRPFDTAEGEREFLLQIEGV